MNKIKLLLSLMLLAASGALVAQNASQTLIKIGDEPISAEAFWNIYQKNNADNSIDKKSLKEYLDLYTVFKLKVHEAKALKKDTSAHFAQELAGYRKQLAKPYLTDEKIHTQLIEEAYERMQKDIRASHILIMAPQDALPADTLKAYEKIKKIRQEIAQGDISFSEAAVKYSDDRSARDIPAMQGRPARAGNKGDLGFFTVFDMVYAFEVPAYEVAVGEMSQPIRTRYGYHLIKKTDEIDAIGRAQVAHIYIKDMATNPQRDEAAAKAKIEAAQQKLQAGERFEDVVKTMSDDKGSIPQGGKLPWFEANRMVPQFIKQIALFDSIGQVSAPIQTPFGWHIIKLIGQEPIKSFADNEQSIKDRLKKDVRSAQGKHAKVAQIKAAEGFEDYPEVLAPLGDTLSLNFVSSKYNFDAANHLTPLCKVGNSIYTVGNFMAFIRKHESKVSDRDDLKRKLYRYYNDFTDAQCIDYENNQLESKYPEFAMLMDEYRDGILLFDLMDEKVWSKAVKDTTGYEAYYQAHKKDYRWNKRADVGIFTILNTAVVDTLQQLAAEGMADIDILNAIHNDSLKMVKYERRALEKGQMPEVDAMKWKAGTKQLFYTEATHSPQYFIVMHNKLSPTTKALNECRGKVISDYQKVLEKEWVEDLRAKYPIEIDTELLKELKTNGLTK